MSVWQRFLRRRQDNREWELARREREADEMLYREAPALAIALGFVPPARQTTTVWQRDGKDFMTLPANPGFGFPEQVVHLGPAWQSCIVTARCSVLGCTSEVSVSDLLDSLENQTTSPSN